MQAQHLLPLQLAIRASAAAGVSVGAAQLLGLPHPIYALIAAVIVMDLDPTETRRLAARRVVGTVVGAGVGALASPWLHGSGLGIAVAVLATMLLCQALRLQGAARLSGYICGIVVLEFSGEPWRYALARFVETLLGIVVALGVSFVPKLMRADPPTAEP